MKASHLMNVKSHLLIHGNLSSWEAIQKWGNTRLAATICTLRKEGMNIESIWEHNADSRWVRYYLREEAVAPPPQLF